MKRGKNWVNVPVQDEEGDCTFYEVLVDWEYDPQGGNEIVPYWLSWDIIKFPEGVTDEEKKLIEFFLEDMDIEKIMLSEYD